MLRIKRIYEQPAAEDGTRILVDRLWPRGISRDAARIDDWLKEIAPSGELRRWFGHDPAKWDEFRSRYRKELAGQTELLARLQAMARQGTVTLLYGAKDETHNQAVALCELLETSDGTGPVQA